MNMFPCALLESQIFINRRASLKCKMEIPYNNPLDVTGKKIFGLSSVWTFACDENIKTLREDSCDDFAQQTLNP